MLEIVCLQCCAVQVQVKHGSALDVFACMRGFHLDDRADLFSHFSFSFYEKWWHEVFKFLICIRPLLGTMRATWDAQKFLKGFNGDEE